MIKFKFSITDQLFLETLLMELRGKAIYDTQATKKKLNNKQEQDICKEIQEIELNCNYTGQTDKTRTTAFAIYLRWLHLASRCTCIF